MLPISRTGLWYAVHDFLFEKKLCSKFDIEKASYLHGHMICTCLFKELWEYIFPRPRKVSPRDGTEVKTCFICRGKVSFSAVVEKKDSCLPERSKGRQHREVRQRSEVRQSFWAETKEKETFSRQRKWSDRTVSIPGILTFIARG